MKYIQQKLQRLAVVNDQIAKLKQQQKSLEEETFEDVVDGWDAKDDALNFSLVACNGHYDKSDIQLYRDIINHVQKYEGEYICYARKQLAKVGVGFVMCVTFELGILSGDVGFDIDHQHITIGIQGEYVALYQDIFDKESGQIMAAMGSAKNNHIVVYPFLNKYDHRSYIEHESIGISIDVDYTKQPFSVICGTRNVQQFFQKNLPQYNSVFVQCEGDLITYHLGGGVGHKVVSLF